MQRLPIGNQSFGVVRDKEKNYVYVDKTKLIYELLEEGNKYNFISRPRRFGKSLTMDTIRYLYQGKKEFFEGLWVYDKWNWEKTNPVVYISFGGGTVNIKELENKLESVLNNNCEDLGIELTEKNTSDRFAQLIKYANKKYNRNVVVIIDEYDKPILDRIENKEQAKQAREILKGFYGVLKDSDIYLEKLFLTGVTKFSKVSLFSGLNNLKDLTLNSKIGELFGFTNKEITDNFGGFLNDVDRIKLKKWYNGFNFMGKNKVYNPFDILLFMDSKEYKNYWFETATPTFLINMIKSRKYFIPDLENMEISDEITSSFDLDNLKLETLLFQSGYLTIKEKQDFGGSTLYRLGYPNLEVKKSITNYILTDLVGDIIEKSKNQIAMYRKLESGDLEGFKDVVFSFFSSIPHDWYRKNDIANYEGYYASVFYSYFYGMGMDCIAEDTTNKGKIDLTVTLGNRIYIFEFKIKKQGRNFDLSSIEGMKENEAMIQLRERKYHEKYLSQNKEIYNVGIVFDIDSRNVVYYDFEKVGKD